MIEQSDDIEMERAQTAEDIQAYFQMVEEEEKRALSVNKVVPIRAEVVPKHTDTELIPMTLADGMFGKLVFDPERALQEAASETWLLDDLLPSRGIGFIFGPPGSYKSFMALDMAACIASGKDWHGTECESQGLVVYIAAEGSRGLMERLVAWKRHYQIAVNSLAILPVPVMMDEPTMVRAFSECLERAAEAAGAPVRMVVIDTMARSFSGDENSAQETGAFVNACSMFAEQAGDCFVLVVAHTGKDLTRGMRGSSALDGAADCHFLVTKPNPGQALMKNTKQKDIEMAEPMRFAMEVVSTGIVDRKNRIRRSLVPILESRGEDADPDTEEVTAFDHKDTNCLVVMVKDAQKEGRKLTEDDLRSEFIAYMQSEGKKLDAAKKGWQRAYARAKDSDRIMKAGIYIYPAEGK